MINWLRNSILLRLLWGLMGLYLLNISVDTADLYPRHIPEDLTSNDQESMVEIIVEQVLGFDNALEEFDDPDTEEHNKKKNTKIELLLYLTIEKNNPHLNINDKHRNFSQYEAKLTKGFRSIDSPPPKV